MSEPLAWIDEAAADWDRRGLTRGLVPKPPGLLNFGSNDYLGLAADPRLAEAARSAAAAHGWGAGASPLVNGWTEVHQGLADDLARFEGAEAVALFPSGFAANLGTIAALVGPGDAVYVDRLAHACLIDGAKLSGASLRVFPHNDAERLGAILARERSRYRRVLIATEGIFSMDGDLALLAALADLAERFEAILLVDEAHATGVFGSEGQGAVSECGVAGRVHVRVGTLSKALGSVGGFVAGSRRLIDWLVNQARPLIYSTALPPPVVAAARAALALAQAEPWRRQRVRALGAGLRAALDGAGFEVGPTAGTIVPIILGTPERALESAARLRTRGLFVPAIRPPTVPSGTARLRVSLSAAHSDEELRALALALADR